MNLKNVLLLTTLLGISACATSVYDTVDINVEQEPQQDVLDSKADPMIEHNERLIKEGREDEWRKDVKGLSH
ncbi:MULTISPECIES: hypothetical protein [Shewanella]|uniref:Lipoprotein n=2 Tax=Shewanella TaxID=22 RepID=B1KH93_SHEWM|nr:MULTISPECIES: hypothetical protein [Shewanella]ACA85401.1 hypothetical protein Swoo_1108 [Shewanella woodyi ATCC 51908]MBW8183505.1 hypothetical protein [Shewanella nanhaiensis]